MDNIATKKSITPDRKTLIEIYERYSPAIFRYAYRLLGNMDSAEDCVAETFSRFLKSLQANPRGPENVQAYLYRIAHNLITDTYRRKPPPAVALESELHADPSGSAEQIVGKQMDHEQVRNALMRLPAEQRQVITLRFLEELSHEEAAVIMGKSVEASRALQYRALSSLRDMLVESKNGRKSNE
jgi:RNA polymerase sigma-70 factor (ECF subfamily)